MDNINCLIVDDEPIARDILIHYCAHLSYLRVVAVCGNAIDARTLLKTHDIHLDINMPVMDGIRFLTSLKSAPQVIFTTAYKEHASTAFDLDACDYLVKPFSLERFLIAIDKVTERITEFKGGDNAADGLGQTIEYFFLKSEGKIFKIDYSDLLYAEANGNTTKIITKDTAFVSNMTFTNFQQTLPSPPFIKVHRSFIINKSKISLIEGNRVFIGKNEIPIGANYRDAFFKMLKI